MLWLHSRPHSQPVLFPNVIWLETVFQRSTLTEGPCMRGGAHNPYARSGARARVSRDRPAWSHAPTLPSAFRPPSRVPQLGLSVAQDAPHARPAAQCTLYSPFEKRGLQGRPQTPTHSYSILKRKKNLNNDNSKTFFFNVNMIRICEHQTLTTASTQAHRLGELQGILHNYTVSLTHTHTPPVESWRAVVCTTWPPPCSSLPCRWESDHLSATCEKPSASG